MTISYYAARANLYQLWQRHPDWKPAEFAAALGYSKAWVKKWRVSLAGGTGRRDLVGAHLPRLFSCAQATACQDASAAGRVDPLDAGSAPRKLTPRPRARGDSLLFRTRSRGAVLSVADPVVQDHVPHAPSS